MLLQIIAVKFTQTKVCYSKFFMFRRSKAIFVTPILLFLRIVLAQQIIQCFAQEHGLADALAFREPA